MTPSVDALELLTSQPDELDAIIGQLENVDGDQRVIVIAKLADKRCTHLVVQEELLSRSVTGSLAVRESSETVQNALANVRGADFDSPDLDLAQAAVSMDSLCVMA